jgi:hypothetical protein
MATQDSGATPAGSAEEGDSGGGSTGGGISRAVQLPACPACRAPIRRSFRYSAIVRRCVIQIAEIKLRTSAGFELRGTVMTALKDYERATKKKHLAALDSHLRDLRRRIKANSSAATPRLLLGELLVRRAELAAPPEAAAPQRAAPAEASPVDSAEEHFEEALRLVGYVDGRALDAPPAGAFPPLSVRHCLIVAHLALLQLGVQMAASGAAQQEGAKRRLLAAKTCATLAGLASEVDIDAILKNTEAAQEELVKSAMTGVERGSWHACPNGHRYLIGECGGAMEQSRCPDCSAAVGGANHALVGDNRAIDQTPYGRAAEMPPDLDVIARAQRGLD